MLAKCLENYHLRTVGILLIFLMLLVGCGGGDGDGKADGTGSSNPPASDSGRTAGGDNEGAGDDEGAPSDGGVIEVAAPYRIDLTDATGIIITRETGFEGAPQVEGTAVAANVGDGLDAKSIYKMDAQGIIIKVEVRDESGAAISKESLQPFRAAELSERYVLMDFMTGNDLMSVLVDRQTGLVVEGNTLPYAHDVKWVDQHDSGFHLARWASKESPHYVRFQADGSYESKSDLPIGPDQIAVAAGDDGENFLAYVGESREPHAANGTVMRFISLNTPEPVLTRILFIDNGYWEDGSEMEVMDFLIKGDDGNVYVLSGQPGKGVAAFRLGVDEQGLPIYEDTNILVTMDVPTGISATWGIKRVIIGGRTFYIHSSEDQYLGPIEVDIANGEISKHRPELGIYVRWRQATENYLWYLGTSQSTGLETLMRYDPVSEELVQYGTPGFEMSRIWALGGDQVLVSGYSVGEQATVYGFLSEGGVFTKSDIFSRHMDGIEQILPL